MATVGILDETERALLRKGRPGRSSAGWSEADLPLLDEAQAVLSDPPRRYGHVVVDEAQDMSAMAFRMVARRNLSGRSFTVLGDLAQATAPGAQERWQDAFAALGMPQGRARRGAHDRLPGVRSRSWSSPTLCWPRRVRPWSRPGRSGGPTTIPSCVRSTRRITGGRGGRRGGTPARQAPDRRGRGHRRCGRGRVRAAPADRGSVRKAGQSALSGEVSVLRPPEAKGLEFDAVIVVEPADFVALGGGTGLLYIALTRAVAHLSVVYSKDLTPALLPAA